MIDYTKLKSLLENETYPHRYMHKFIGRNTPEFLAGVLAFEKAFPKASRTTSRPSATSEASEGASSSRPHSLFVALTYEFEADSADEIIQLLEATYRIEHLRVIL